MGKTVNEFTIEIDGALEFVRLHPDHVNGAGMTPCRNES